MAANIPNDNITLPASWRGRAPVFVAVGAIAVLLSLGIFYFTNTEKAELGFRTFFHSYLANFIYCLSFCLGALFFVMVSHLARAGWSASIRRIAELYAYTIPWWALLFLPILAMVLFTPSDALYAWNGNVDNLTHVVQEKLVYLNPIFFSLRTAVYFAVFIIAASVYFKMSRKQDDTGDTEITLKLQRWAGPFIMLFALALNFASFDWMMSTDAGWFSTMYGVYLFAASMLSFFAVMIVTCYLLQRNGRIESLVTTEHYHDMSKFQFGFIVFWAYIAFSQFMLYWYGNIPEETLWYKYRMNNNWQWLGLALIVFHFAIPFLGTVSRHVRRNRGVMAGWAGLLLVAHWLDMTFLIMPNVSENTPMSVPLLFGHLICWIGMVSLFIALFLWRVGDTPVVAVKDPWLPDALAYHNV
ncbi:MAG: quinol:cytochrome C oxidoreductase [Pirellulaceae bacterium]